MTENRDTAPDNEHLDTTPPPPPATPPPAAPPAAQEPTRWRDRRVGVLTLTVSTAAALIVGGTLGTVTGGAVGYGVGQHDHPDRPGFLQRHDGPQAGMPGGQQFQPPNGVLPPGAVPNGSDDSDGSSS